VAFGQNETVVVVVMRIFWVIFHVPEKKLATTSAASSRKWGWPLPAAVVALME